jgi:hypothetical protein
MANQDEEIGKMQGILKSVSNDVIYLRSKFDQLDDRLDKKFAAKWVEKLSAGMIAFILMAVLGAIVYMVIPFHNNGPVGSPSAHAATKNNNGE